MTLTPPRKTTQYDYEINIKASVDKITNDILTIVIVCTCIRILRNTHASVRAYTHTNSSLAFVPFSHVILSFFKSVSHYRLLLTHTDKDQCRNMQPCELELEGRNREDTW